MEDIQLCDCDTDTSITIIPVDNGWIITRGGENIVVENGDGSDNDDVVQLLTKLADMLGSYDKWGANNIVISSNGKGHKV